MYRPQFAFKSPANCEEQRCVYSFDWTNTPVLGTTLLAGANFQRIPLVLDKDADFYLRGLLTTTIDGLEFRLEDPSGHPLSDTGNTLEELNYEYPGLYSDVGGALDNCDDYGVYCQAGSRLYLYLLNNTAAPHAVDILLTPFIVNLHGIKRYSGDRCAA